MDLHPIPEMVDGLPNLCGADAQVDECTRGRNPVYLHETNVPLGQIRACFAVALHMQQPLIPVGGGDLRSADIISNLDHMMRNQGIGDNHNAHVFADCYGRTGDLIREQVERGRSPRIMLDYSGELLYGLRKMGRGDVIDRLRPITCDPHLRKHVEWLGTMWGHAVAPSTPPSDYVLQMRAWQQNFAAVFGWDALARVRGFSPPEMHLPNHPDVAFEYVKALKECGYRWLMVQEHTIETPDGHGLPDRHIPYRLLAKSSLGEEVSILALIKTQGSDTKLVGQMQPFYEAQGQQRRTIGGVSIPAIVTQIGDGENGGVMMNEFPSAFRQACDRMGGDVIAINGTEYLEYLDQAGVRERMLPCVRPLGQGKVLSRIQKWEAGAADKAIAEIKRENAGFSMDGGSWTNNISWVQGYDNVLTPMNRLSAQFHQTLDNRSVDKNSRAYRNALFHLLVAETSCFRYWGQGAWTDYAKEICRRGSDILSHDFK